MRYCASIGSEMDHVSTVNSLPVLRPRRRQDDFPLSPGHDRPLPRIGRNGFAPARSPQRLRARLKSPGIVCFSALAATANRSASSATAGDEAVDQSGGEAVAAADAIDEPHVVALALMQRRRWRASQSTALQPLSLADRLSRSVIATIGRTRSRSSRARRRAEAADVQLPARDIGALDVHAEHRLQVLLVGDDDVDVRISGRITCCACASDQSFLR